MPTWSNSGNGGYRAEWNIRRLQFPRVRRLPCSKFKANYWYDVSIFFVEADLCKALMVTINCVLPVSIYQGIAQRFVRRVVMTQQYQGHTAVSPANLSRRGRAFVYGSVLLFLTPC